jgi:addiction module RelE/StbE family toxin
MKIVYDPVFINTLKKVNVRIRKSFKECILLFSKDPHNLKLNNHALRNKYQGYRSIDVTADHRAIYKERYKGEETIAYFTQLGTHKQLYRK